MSSRLDNPPGLYCNTKVSQPEDNPQSKINCPVSHLGESNVLRVYAEALAAHVESVLADQAVLVRAHAAVASALAVLLGVGVNQSLGTHGF